MRAVLTTALLLLPGPAAADQVVLFAASSLTNALAEVETAFESASGHDLVVSLGGSPAMARQILDGAPADVFLSASPEWMDVLETEGLIEPGTRVDLLGNTLVLVAHGPAAPVDLAGLDLAGMLQGGFLSMAMVDAVPAGVYGRAALQSLGLWEAVAPQVAQSENVRAALQLVALGEAPLGIVFASDALAEAAVSVIATFPADSHPPVVYPLADLTTRDTAAEGALMAFLQSPPAQEIFGRHGFLWRAP